MIILLLLWGFYTTSDLENTVFFVKVKNLGSGVIPTSIFFKINIMHACFQHKRKQRKTCSLNNNC